MGRKEIKIEKEIMLKGLRDMASDDFIKKIITSSEKNAFNMQSVVLMGQKTQLVVNRYQEWQKLQWNIVSQTTSLVKYRDSYSNQIRI